MEENKIEKILENAMYIQEITDEIGSHAYTIHTVSNEIYKITLCENEIKIQSKKSATQDYSDELHISYDNILYFSIIDIIPKFTIISTTEVDSKHIITDNFVITTSFFVDILSYKSDKRKSETFWDQKLNEFIADVYRIGLIFDFYRYVIFFKLACESGSIKVFKYLMSRFPEYFNELKQDTKWQSILTSSACYGGNYEIIHILEDKDFNFDNIALKKAIERGCFEIFEYLVNNEIVTDFSDLLCEIIKEDNKNNFSSKKYCNEDVFGTITYNLEEKLKNTEDEEKIEYIKNIQEQIRETIEKGEFSVINSKFILLYYLIFYPGFDINKPDKDGNTSFSYAVYNDIEIVKLLLQQPGIEKSLNMPNKHGNTPLHLAICNNDIEIVKLLLQQPGIEGSLNVSNKHEDTPLHLAIYNNDIEIVKLLLQQPGIEKSLNMPNKTTRNKFTIRYTPLGEAIIKSGLEIVKLILNHKDLNIKKEEFLNLKQLAKKDEKISALLNEKFEEIKKKETKTVIEVTPNSASVFTSVIYDMENNTLVECEKDITSFNKEKSNDEVRDDLY